MVTILVLNFVFLLFTSVLIKCMDLLYLFLGERSKGVVRDIVTSPLKLRVSEEKL